MIKVLHLLPMNKLSGAERMALLICKQMNDVESFVITGGEHLAAVFQNEGIQAKSLNFSIKQMPQLTKQLNHFIKSNHIDIIHAHDNIASLSAYLTKKRYQLNVKVISHIHNCYPWLEGNGIYKKIDQWIRPKYDYNIACGKTVYNYYKQYAPYFNQEKTTILSNAIDMSLLGTTSQSKIDELKETFNISSHQTIIGYIGRLSEQKGMIPFIKELVNYKEQFTDCQFLIIGSGEQEDEIKQLIKTLGLDDLFVFTGFQADIYPFYQLIDIFFLPSLYEGLPMVLLEAMGSAVPTISMDVGSIGEVIENKKNGLLVNAREYSLFIEELIYLKCDYKLREKISNFAIKSITKKYSIHSYNELLKTIYLGIK